MRDHATYFSTFFDISVVSQFQTEQIKISFPCITISGVSREDIHVEAVLVAHHRARIVRRTVDALVPVLPGVAGALPSGGRGRGLEAEMANRRLGEGDSVERDVRIAIAGHLLYAGYIT